VESAILEHNQGMTVQPNYSPDPSGPTPTPASPQRRASGDRTRQKYNRLIDSPELQNLTFLEKEFLRQRWLDQMIWFSDKASLYRDRHYRIRIVTVIGSILVPAMISLGSVCTGAFFLQLPETTAVSPGVAPTYPVESGTPAPPSSTPAASVSLVWSRFFLFTGLGLSQIVAILAGVDQFFKFGDRWRHYRSTAELLKTHGWQFLELSGPYESYASNGDHKAAFPVFANQVEEIIQSDVDGYVTQIATQKSFNQGVDNTRF
jgi:hypothetical protein